MNSSRRPRKTFQMKETTEKLQFIQLNQSSTYLNLNIMKKNHWKHVEMVSIKFIMKIIAILLHLILKLFPFRTD